MDGGLGARLREIREQIGDACARVGRDPSEVTLVGVTKRHPADVCRLAAHAGVYLA